MIRVKYSFFLFLFVGIAQAEESKQVQYRNQAVDNFEARNRLTSRDKSSGHYVVPNGPTFHSIRVQTERELAKGRRLIQLYEKDRKRRSDFAKYVAYVPELNSFYEAAVKELEGIDQFAKSLFDEAMSTKVTEASEIKGKVFAKIPNLRKFISEVRDTTWRSSHILGKPTKIYNTLDGVAATTRWNDANFDHVYLVISGHEFVEEKKDAFERARLMVDLKSPRATIYLPTHGEELCIDLMRDCEHSEWQTVELENGTPLYAIRANRFRNAFSSTVAGKTIRAFEGTATARSMNKYLGNVVEKTFKTHKNVQDYRESYLEIQMQYSHLSKMAGLFNSWDPFEDTWTVTTPIQLSFIDLLMYPTGTVDIKIGDEKMATLSLGLMTSVEAIKTFNLHDDEIERLFSQDENEGEVKALKDYAKKATK